MSKRMIPCDEEIKRIYLEEKKSCKEICRMFGLSENSSSNIGIRLKKMGVTIRKDKGKEHHNWKGGKILKGDDYIGIWKPEHERADKQGYVYEHTLVYENKTGKLPKKDEVIHQKDEVIHHIDLDKHNNNFNNLYLCNNKQHIETHRSIEKLIKPLLEKEIIEFHNGKYILKK